MKYLQRSKIFAFVTVLLAIGLLINVYAHVNFLFYPLEVLLASLFPIALITIFLYYIFLPVYEFLYDKIKRDWIVIPIIFALILFIIYFLISSILPEIIRQLTTLVRSTPNIVNNLVSYVEQFMIQNNISSNELYGYISDIDVSITNVLSNILEQFLSSLANIISLTMSSIVVVATVPLLLFFLYKDGQKMPQSILTFVPHKYKQLVGDLMSAFHFNAKNYIGGRIIVCAFVGIFSYVIFLLLGLPNTLLLALICAIADIIPYFGPIIGAAPAFLVAFSISPLLALGVAVFIFILQQIESYVFTPFVLSSSLELHPVTVALLVIFAKDAFGVLGMILVLPTYAIIKGCSLVIIRYLREEKGIQFKHN